MSTEFTGRLRAVVRFGGASHHTSSFTAQANTPPYGGWNRSVARGRPRTAARWAAPARHQGVSATH